MIESNKVKNVKAGPLLKIYGQIHKVLTEAKNLFSRSVCASGLGDGVLVSNCWVSPSGVPDRYEPRISQPSTEISHSEAVYDLMESNLLIFSSGF
jgi:hypothetical protein